MTLSIYNSLSRKKEPFRPRVAGKVGMYVCGMTVYDFCHLGHARVLVVFDMVVRVLRSQGLDVQYVRNITDIDDKIIVRANELSEPIDTLTSRFIDAMHEDEAALNVMPPDEDPRATGHIRSIIDMVSVLQERGLAYQGSNGDVYFRVRKFPGYGALSGRSLDELLTGARVEKDEAKDDPLDFVLWKTAKANEPSWPSPWGDGRPGWHIECSAMSTQCLGDHFDIHGGGMDLRFPHHENEIAQSEGATGERFVNTWMHNGFVQIDEEKMSKSLGNFLTIRNLLADDPDPNRAGEVIRFLILLSHYRSPLNFSDGVLSQARSGLDRLYAALRLAPAKPAGGLSAVGRSYEATFRQALDDDFNTPSAIAVLFELAREINKASEARDTALVDELGCALKRLADVLGILYQDPERFLGIGSGARAGVDGILSAQEIENLLVERRQARESRDFARADEIRDQLEQMGVELMDRPDGSTEWRAR
ncbi:MAG: cysteine--tRNA ligase [Gammaproteobacteria bacterium]